MTLRIVTGVTAATPPASPWRSTPASPSPTPSSATTTSSATSLSDPQDHVRLRLVTRFLPAPQVELLREGVERRQGRVERPQGRHVHLREPRAQRDGTRRPADCRRWSASGQAWFSLNSPT